MGRGLLRAPLCALLRHAGVGSWGQVQPPLPLPCRRSSCGWGRPPGPGGAEGRACGSPAGVGAGGGGGGPTPPALGPVWEGGGGGGGSEGGSSGSLAMPPVGQKKGGGGGGLAVPAPGASHRLGGSRPSPAPLYRVPDPPAVPPWGPSSLGRCRAALAGRGWP